MPPESDAVRFAGSCLIVVLCLIASGVAPVGAVSEAPRVVEASGYARQGGIVTVVEVLLVVPAGGSEDEARRDALDAFGARQFEEPPPPPPPPGGDEPPGEEPPSDVPLSGWFWAQFLDRSRRNDAVLQSYSTLGDPTGGAGRDAFLRAQGAWSAVEGTTFAFADGGVTDRCVACGGLDGHNDVGWGELEFSRALAVTFTAFRVDTMHIVETDVVFSPHFPWSTDGSGFDLETVMLHEDGHVIGLGHASFDASIMAPSLPLGVVKRALHAEDEEAVRRLYPLDFDPIRIPRDPPRVEPPERPVRYQELLALGDPAPGYGTHLGDFEPYGASARGDLLVGTDTEEGEGLWLVGRDGVSTIARSGEPAPGGGTFGLGVWPAASLADNGDAAFAFALEPFTRPTGANSGLYRWEAATGTLRAVLVPGVTPAPGGGTFVGAHAQPSLAADGDLVFAALHPTTLGAPHPTIGKGVFVQERGGAIRPLVVPGDPAPGGGTFDFVESPAANRRGDVAFIGHVAGDPCAGGARPERFVHCDGGLYLRAATGEIRALLPQFAPLPDGATLLWTETPVMNDRGDVLAPVFVETPEGWWEERLVLLRGGEVVDVVRTGTGTPDGDAIWGFGFHEYNWDLNDAGDVAFSASLFSFDVETFTSNTGLFLWRDGDLRLLARSGTEVPGVGTVAQLRPWAYQGLFDAPFGGAILTERGEVAFGASFRDGTDRLLVATAT